MDHGRKTTTKAEFVDGGIIGPARKTAKLLFPPMQQGQVQHLTLLHLK